MNEIEKIVVDSIALAKKFNHEYVTIEHLMTVVLDEPLIRAMCYEVQSDAMGIQEALLTYLNENCAELVYDQDIESQPRKTQMLERVFNRALTQALFQGKKGINFYDLLLSILSEENCVAVQFSNQLGLNKLKIATWLNDALQEQVAPLPANARQGTQAAKKQGAYAAIEEFCTNMNVECNDYEDVVGRRAEMRDLVQTLARKKKSNAILVGPSGVGKTAIVEGIVKLIVEGNVPNTIDNMTVYSLDMAKLVAGTKYRGDFEERMKGLSEALEVVDDVILFIDEIHMVIGAGSTSGGSMDAGNMLKPALSNGKAVSAER